MIVSTLQADERETKSKKIDNDLKHDEEYCISGKEAREREKINAEYEEQKKLEKCKSIMQVRNFNKKVEMFRESITRALETEYVSEQGLATVIMTKVITMKPILRTVIGGTD